MNPMMPMGGMGGMGGMPPPQMGGMSQTTPNPMDMQMLLQMLGDPMGTAMAMPAQGPLSPEEQVMLAIMGAGKTPTAQQVPDMMALMQMLGGGSGYGMPANQPQPPMQMPMM